MPSADYSAADLLARAAELDRQARSEEALQVLEGCGDWPVPYNERGLLLRAKMLFVRDPIAALDALPEDEGAFETYDARIGALLISARAYMAARNLRLARAAIRRAEILLKDGDDENRRLVASNRAYMSWQQREYDPNNQDIADAMRAADPALRLNMLNLRAWMHCGLEDYSSQARDLIQCLRLYECNPSAYQMRVIARTLHSVLGLAWEIADIQAGEEARRNFESMPWTPDLELYRFLCLRGLGWHTFLAGDSEKAYHLFDTAKRAAPSRAWLVMAHTDHAYVGRLNGDEPMTRYELEQAQALASTVDWASTRLEEKNALLTAAILLVPIDVSEAQRLLAAYSGLQAHALDAGIEVSHEPRRLFASLHYADGIIQATLGRGPSAIRLLTDAYGTFAHFNFAFRAMLAAEALFGITKEARWLEAALHHAGAYPNALLAERMKRAFSS